MERINTFKEDFSEMLAIAEPVDFKDMVVFFEQWRKKIAGELL